MPGPAVLLVLTRTAQGGRSVGIATGAGIATGDLIHTVLAAVGLSALLMTSSLAFSVVKLCGAGYLLWLGVRAFMERPATPSTSSAETPAAPAIRASKAFWQAIPAELLNPKTALFFLAFMPQFVHAEHGHALVQFLILGVVFSAMSIVYSARSRWRRCPSGARRGASAGCSAGRARSSAPSSSAGRARRGPAAVKDSAARRKPSSNAKFSSPQAGFTVLYSFHDVPHRAHYAIPNRRTAGALIVHV